MFVAHFSHLQSKTGSSI